MIAMVVVIDVQVNPLTWKCKCKVDAGFPLFAFVCHRWDGILSAVSAPFTAFLEPITRLSPPHQPWVSTHWRTVKNLLSLSCISQEGVHAKECFHFQSRLFRLYQICLQSCKSMPEKERSQTENKPCYGIYSQITQNIPLFSNAFDIQVKKCSRLWYMVVGVICWSWAERGNHCLLEWWGLHLDLPTIDLDSPLHTWYIWMNGWIIWIYGYTCNHQNK